jgi:exonuclease SbcC
MQLNKLVMKNFKKFRRVEIEFSEGLTGIVGSNGSGKSTIVDAIAWALYGNRASGIKRDFIRNVRSRESDAVEASLTISLGKQELVIYRAMKGKGLMPEAYLVLDGQRIATGSREVDARLEAILKISYQDFMKTFYARQKDLDNLLKEGAMGKREYLIKLLGLEDIKECAIGLIKTDRSSLDERKNRLAGALAEMGDISAEIDRTFSAIQAAGMDLDDAERRKDGLAAAEDQRRQELDSMAEKMRLHGILSERAQSLEAQEKEMAVAAKIEEDRINLIESSKKRLSDIAPLLKRLSTVKERLDVLEPQRVEYERSARSVASLTAALQAGKKSLAESKRMLEELEKNDSERENLRPLEEEHLSLQERIVALEESRDRYRELEAKIKEQTVLVQSMKTLQSRAEKLRDDLLISKVRLNDISGCKEEEKKFKEELSELLRQREKKKGLDVLLVRKSGIEERLARLKIEAERAEQQINNLSDIDGKEAALLRQDRDLDHLNSELSLLLADMRGSYKVAENALAEAEGALMKVRELGEDGQCPTCERPLSGQRDLLISKYENSMSAARGEKEKIAAGIAVEIEKLEGVTRSRSNLRLAFDQLNSQKSQKAALQAQRKGQSIQIGELEAERREILAEVERLGDVLFDVSRIEQAEAALKRLEPLVLEYEMLLLRLDDLPGLETEISLRMKEIRDVEEKLSRLAGEAEALGYRESDFLLAKKRIASIKPMHDRFLALTERVATIPDIVERKTKQEHEMTGLESALEAQMEAQRMLGYDPGEYESLLTEKRELMSAESEMQRISIVLAGESEARKRLASARQASERMNSILKEIRRQKDDLAYRNEVHEMARARLASAKEELENARKRTSEMQVQMGVLLAKKERLKKEAERKVELERNCDQLSCRLEVVDVTRDLLNSFMDQVLIRVKNDIARTAGEILEEVSGKYSLLKIDDDFNILVEDAGSYYPISRYSGGEIDMIAVSVRVAISEYLMRFSPEGESYSFLILDEVFGSQDQEHREKMIQMLRSLEERFPQIIAISHISDVQGQFDNTIHVVEDEFGNSRVEAV